MSNLEPLRPAIVSLKAVEKADFRSASESKDVKWRQRMAKEIDIELSESEDERVEQARIKREDTKHDKKVVQHRIREREDGLKKFTGSRKNVFLTSDELKKLSEQLKNARQEGSIRHESKGLTERDHSNKGRNKSVDTRMKVRKAGKSPSGISGKWVGDTPGQFEFRNSNLRKRAPKSSGSKKKFGKKAR